MNKLIPFLQHHELILSIGIFGIAQMGADILADLGWGYAAALVRGFGILALFAILFWSMRHRSACWRCRWCSPKPRSVRTPARN